MSDRPTTDRDEPLSEGKPFDDERFDELLSRLVDGRLDGQFDGRDARELAAVLERSSAAREAYVRYISLHAWLSWDAPAGGDVGARSASGTWSVSSAGETGLINAAPPGVVANVVSRSIAFFAKPTPLSVSVATIVVAVVIAALALVPLGGLIAPGERPHEASRTAAEEADAASPRRAELPVVARVGRTVAPQWTNDSRPLEGGDPLRQGDSLHLADGAVEVLFDGGARATLRGPAQFVVLSPSAGRLYSGRLVARVESAGSGSESPSGFVVDTQAVVVKDLGTEFSIYVDRSLSSLVRVFEGAVEAASHRADGEPPAAPMRLVAGDAMRFDLDGPPAALAREAQGDDELLRRPITYRDVVVADRPLLYWSFDEADGPADEQAHGVARYRLYPRGEARRAAHEDLGSGLALGRAADLRGVGVFEGRIQHAGPPSAWALELWIALSGDADGFSSRYVLHTNPGGRAGRGFPSNNPSLIFDYHGGADNELALHSSANVGAGRELARTAGGPLLADGRWHHLLFVFYGDGVRGVEDRVELYWDGKPVDSIRRQRFSAGFRVDTLLVGATRVEGDRRFDGLVDEIAVYDFGGLSSRAIERRAAEMVRRHRHAAKNAPRW